MLACLDIGGSLIKVARMNEARMPNDVLRMQTPPDGPGFIAAIAGIIAGLGTGLIGVSLSMTGIVDPASQKLRIANLPALDGLALGPLLTEATGLPVTVANDADCFALAEAVHGAGKGHGNVFCVILGSGVGGSLVINGRLVEGEGGFAGEWGHGTILMQRAGRHQTAISHRQCGCGQWGCVNTVGGARGLEALVRQLTDTDRSSTDILQEWLAGDAEMETILDIWLDLVSAPLAMTLNVTGSSIVPVGGGLSNVGALVAALDQRVRARLLRQTSGPVLVKAELSGEAGLLGAALNGFRVFGHG